MKYHLPVFLDAATSLKMLFCNELNMRPFTVNPLRRTLVSSNFIRNIVNFTSLDFNITR